MYKYVFGTYNHTRKKSNVVYCSFSFYMHLKFLAILAVCVFQSVLSFSQSQANTHRDTIPYRILGVENDTLLGKWVERGTTNQPGAVTSVAYNSSEHGVYAISNRGSIWFTKLDSVEWKVLNDQNLIDKPNSILQFTSSNQTRLVVSNYGGEVLYSDDSCKTWQRSNGLSTIKQEGSIYKMIRSGNSSIFIIAQEFIPDSGRIFVNLFFSKDKGTKFKNLMTFDTRAYPSVNNFDIHSPTDWDSSTFFYYRDSIAEFNSNSGIIKSKIFPQPTLWGELWLTGGRYADSLYLSSYVREFFYESNGKGNGWKSTTYNFMPFKNPYTNSYTKTNRKTLFVGNSECYVSKLSGDSFKLVNNWKSYLKHPKDSLHKGINSINRYDDKNGNEFHLITTDGGLYISKDQLNSVTNLSLNNHRTSQLNSSLTLLLDEMHFYATAINQGFQRISDTAKSIFKAQQLQLGEYGQLSSSDSGKTVWITSKTKVYFMQNGQSDTTLSNFWNFSDSLISNLTYPKIVADPKNSNKSYLIGVHKKSDPDKKSFIYSLEFKNGKILWQVQNHNFNLALSKNEFVSGLTTSPLQDSLWYSITNNGSFYYSYNYGQTWTRASFFNGPKNDADFGTSIYASKSHINHVYVAGDGKSNKAVHYSWNKGRDWKHISNGLPRTYVHQLTANHDDSLLFAATDAGPYVYSLKDGKWFTMNNQNAPSLEYNHAEYLPKTKSVRFATNGRGVWDFQLETIPVDTTDTTSLFYQNLPSSNLRLYPNPTKGNEVRIKNIEGEFKYRIMDLNGSTISSGISESLRIKLENMLVGNYIVEVKESNKNTSYLKLAIIE